MNDDVTQGKEVWKAIKVQSLSPYTYNSSLFNTWFFFQK